MSIHQELLQAQMFSKQLEQPLSCCHKHAQES